MGEAGFRAEPTRVGVGMKLYVDRANGGPACLGTGLPTYLCVTTALAGQLLLHSDFPPVRRIVINSPLAHYALTFQIYMVAGAHP